MGVEETQERRWREERQGLCFIVPGAVVLAPTRCIHGVHPPSASVQPVWLDMPNRDGLGGLQAEEAAQVVGAEWWIQKRDGSAVLTPHTAPRALHPQSLSPLMLASPARLLRQLIRSSAPLPA